MEKVIDYSERSSSTEIDRDGARGGDWDSPLPRKKIKDIQCGRGDAVSAAALSRESRENTKEIV